MIEKTIYLRQDPSFNGEWMLVISEDHLFATHMNTLVAPSVLQRMFKEICAACEKEASKVIFAHPVGKELGKLHKKSHIQYLTMARYNTKIKDAERNRLERHTIMFGVKFKFVDTASQTMFKMRWHNNAADLKQYDHG